MRKLLVAIPVALIVAAPALAAPSPNKATGGGQILLSNSSSYGSTIAFTAQGTPEAAKGQVQVIDRSAGTGQSQVKFHGIVECILVQGNMAEIAGVERDSGDPFTLRAVDNGEGANAGNDMIFFDDVEDDERCESDDNDDDDAQVALARGNVQVHPVKS